MTVADRYSGMEPAIGRAKQLGPRGQPQEHPNRPLLFERNLGDPVIEFWFVHRVSGSDTESLAGVVRTSTLAARSDGRGEIDSKCSARALSDRGTRGGKPWLHPYHRPGREKACVFLGDHMNLVWRVADGRGVAEADNQRSWRRARTNRFGSPYSAQLTRISWDHGLEYMLAKSGEAREPGLDSFAELRQRLPEVKRWFLALPVDGSVLFNALSYVLAPVSDLDPAFVKLALDLDTWRSIVRTDQTLDEASRSQRLRAIDSGHLPHAINNALLHVLAALANNHFGVIADFLDHPCLSGAYTGLIPHYLFAVLLEKVKTLRSLAKLANGHQ